MKATYILVASGGALLVLQAFARDGTCGSLFPPSDGSSSSEGQYPVVSSRRLQCPALEHGAVSSSVYGTTKRVSDLARRRGGSYHNNWLPSRVNLYGIVRQKKHLKCKYVASYGTGPRTRAKANARICRACSRRDFCQNALFRRAICLLRSVDGTTEMDNHNTQEQNQIMHT